MEARLQAHHAVQLVAAIGRGLVTARPDDGHTSLEWLDATECLAGALVQGPRPWRAALRVDGLRLEVHADDGKTVAFDLIGRTKKQARDWLRAEAGRLGAEVARIDPATAPYTIPEHPVGAGQRFAPPPEALAELARWIADGNLLLRGLAATWAGAAPVRLWPHHFDVGSVLPLEQRAGEAAPSIGVGLSPGDEGSAEPYFYVTPWPAPSPDALPALPAGGRWHREGWVGAMLVGGELVKGGEEQERRAREFLYRTASAVRHGGGGRS